MWTCRQLGEPGLACGHGQRSRRGAKAAEQAAAPCEAASAAAARSAVTRKCLVIAVSLTVTASWKKGRASSREPWRTWTPPDWHIASASSAGVAVLGKEGAQRCCLSNRQTHRRRTSSSSPSKLSVKHELEADSLLREKQSGLLEGGERLGVLARDEVRLANGANVVRCERHTVPGVGVV